MRQRKYSRETKITTCITVTADECRGDAEKMVRKFCKKVKKDGIIDEFRDRTHFKKKTVARTEKKRAKKRFDKIRGASGPQMKNENTKRLENH